ncbi:MAG: type II toxin-antitoxin system YoeB family toxin [Oscillospiraceae bacterium]|nr:type II toxin-antitoxin system YoeB family toxin [Oscillospiraceae bacterium]
MHKIWYDKAWDDNRKTNDVDRLVYRLSKDTIEIASCKGHYDG